MSRMWKINLRLAGWLLPTSGVVLVLLGFLLARTTWPGTSDAPLAARVIETIVPLTLALQAAFALSPEDEAPLELLLSCPRLPARILLERCMTILVLQGCVAFATTLLSWDTYPIEAGWVRVMRWLAPCLFLCGVGQFTTQVTRQGTYGALLSLLIWGGMLFGGDAMFNRWPFLWPLHLFLQPGRNTLSLYVSNRIALSLEGALLFSMATLQMRQEEHMLGIGSLSQLLRSTDHITHIHD